MPSLYIRVAGPAKEGAHYSNRFRLARLDGTASMVSKSGSRGGIQPDFAWLQARSLLDLNPIALNLFSTCQLAGRSFTIRANSAMACERPTKALSSWGVLNLGAPTETASVTLGSRIRLAALGGALALAMGGCSFTNEALLPSLTGEDPAPRRRPPSRRLPRSALPPPGSRPVSKFHRLPRNAPRCSPPGSRRRRRAPSPPAAPRSGSASPAWRGRAAPPNRRVR